jgi:hypothetical protein
MLYMEGSGFFMTDTTIMTDTTKISDDIFMVPWDQGNGQIRREVWVDNKRKVTHYYLAYINPESCSADEGTVLGYDYNNGSLFSHLMGAITAIEFSSFEELEEQFDIKWENIPKQSGPVLIPGDTDLPEHGLNKIDEFDDYSETKEMKLTITKGTATDFFRHGKALARKLDCGEEVEAEKVVIFGNRHDLCYSGLSKQ